MKYLRLMKVSEHDDWSIKHLAKLEEDGEAYYYDAEGFREVILVHVNTVNYVARRRFKNPDFSIDDDYIDETHNVFVVVVEDLVYVVSCKDVATYLDYLVAKIEIAEMAKADKC